MEFLGHVCRRRGLEFLSLTGKVEGKRDRGKQRITFLDSLCNSATGGQSKGLNFLSCLTTEMFGEAWSPMSVPDLAPDDDDDCWSTDETNKIYFKTRLHALKPKRCS